MSMASILTRRVPTMALAQSSPILRASTQATTRMVTSHRFISIQHLSRPQNQQQQLDDESNAEYLAAKEAGKWSKHSLSADALKQTQEPQPEPEKKTKKRRRRQLKPLKSVITLTPNALHHLKKLMQLPEPKLIRISVQNRGCSGLTYHLEYVTKPEKFDEQVEQDGVKVLIDSKALFSIIGSEMDWIDDKLSSKFVFKNPNSKGSCGCGESFMV